MRHRDSDRQKDRETEGGGRRGWGAEIDTHRQRVKTDRQRDRQEGRQTDRVHLHGRAAIVARSSVQTGAVVVTALSPRVTRVVHFVVLHTLACDTQSVRTFTAFA